MAEENGQEKTEAPTQRRREEARRQGRVAVSADLNSGVLLLVGVLMLGQQAPESAEVVLNRVRPHLLGMSSFELGPDETQHLLFAVLSSGLSAIGWLLGALFAVIVAAGVLQAGLYFNTDQLEVKWERLNPAEGWGRLASLQTVVRGLLSLLKVIAVGLASWWALRGRAVQVVTLGDGTLAGAAAQGWTIVLRTALAVAAVLTGIGVIDYVYQRFRLERSLRMTRQELKEELKREEGDPQVKARIRKAQREAAQRRMLREVPKATVVITNPNHFAVALLYEPELV